MSDEKKQATLEDGRIRWLEPGLCVVLEKTADTVVIDYLPAGGSEGVRLRLSPIPSWLPPYNGPAA